MPNCPLRLKCVLAMLLSATPGVAADASGHWFVSVSDVVVSEESCAPHQAVFTVRLVKRVHNLPDQVVTVEYATADGTAVGGADYTPASGTLTFTPPNHVLTVAVPITDALVPGADKTFTLNLSNPTGAILAKPIGTATLHAPSVAKCASCGLSCDDGIACTADSCSASLGCRNVDVNACATAACELGACALDTDGDSLSDAWETNGYVDLDCNGQYDGPEADVPLPGADPLVPDVYVRYDYMEKTGTGAHTHQPPQAALDQMVSAFELHGVTLHLVAPSGSIPENVVTTLDNAPSTACAGDDFATMESLRASNFGNLQPAYHYMVFGHFSTCPDAAHCGLCPTDPESGATPSPTATGSADVGGDDAIIAAANLDAPMRIERVASTIMHELGHNLGLKHGGDEGVNEKPNYISVMNYTYQFAGISVRNEQVGISCAADADCGPPAIPAGSCATPGACFCTGAHECLGGIPCSTEADCGAPLVTSGPCTTLDACHCGSAGLCYRVDYSNQAYGTLNEASLDENIGVSGPSSSRDIVMYFVPGTPTVELAGESNGSAIDWDNSGSVDSSVSVDINISGGAPESLSSQDDWETSGGLFTRLDFAFQCSTGAGVAGEWTTNEMSRDYALQRRLLLRRQRAPRD